MSIKKYLFRMGMINNLKLLNTIYLCNTVRIFPSSFEKKKRRLLQNNFATEN